MKTKLPIIVLAFTAFLTFAAVTAQGQTCTGFTTDSNDFLGIPEVDLLPTQTWGDTQPFVRGGVEYTGSSLLIGTECPGTYGVLSLCDFSGPVTGVPAAGTILRRFGLDYWADTGINPFQLEIELQSGAIENFTATVNGGFVGYCAPTGETIVRVEMVGHDGTATAIYHGDDGAVPAESLSWGATKSIYRN